MEIMKILCETEEEYDRLIVKLKTYEDYKWVDGDTLDGWSPYEDENNLEPIFVYINNNNRISYAEVSWDSDTDLIPTKYEDLI